MSPSTDGPCVFLGMPLHNRLADIEAAHNLYLPCKPGGGVTVIHWPNVNSSLGHCFNGLLCEAYRFQEERAVTHFAMIHGDVTPESFWLSAMLDEMRRVDADVLSAVIAIKDQNGLTSTGLGYPGRPDWPFRRLTLAEVHGSGLPTTFCHDDLKTAGLAVGEHGEYLAINTGLWVARYDRPWFQENKVVFRQTHQIKRLPRPDGPGTYLQAWFEPEDWIFSRELASWGAKVFATTAVKVDHVGSTAYPSHLPWGEWKTDLQFQRMSNPPGTEATAAL